MDNNPDSGKRSEGVYQQAVCYRRIGEFTKSYEGFKAYMNLGADAEYYQEAEQNVRQFEMDEDGDGYKSYIEQESGTSELTRTITHAGTFNRVSLGFAIRAF